MKKIWLAITVLLAVGLFATLAFAEELPLPKDPDRTWYYDDGYGDDAYGGTERNGEDYVEDGDYHGGNGYRTPGVPGEGEDDDDEDDTEGLTRVNILPLLLLSMIFNGLGY